jgi:hypothetical protein
MNGENNTMKTNLLFLALIFITLLGNCNKNDSSTSNETDYSLNDLEGTWVGYAKNKTDSISLNLTVNSAGRAYSNSASGEWSIDSKGRVKGPGEYLFYSGSTLNYVNAVWSLQLSTDKRKLSGMVDIYYSSLHNMDVILTKD